ncbi:MAG: hypothetical protein Q8M03_06675, partial [Legionella sp.]|nr:hypothetical protein [Legionella sp.]
RTGQDKNIGQDGERIRTGRVSTEKRMNENKRGFTSKDLLTCDRRQRVLLSGSRETCILSHSFSMLKSFHPDLASRSASV